MDEIRPLTVTSGFVLLKFRQGESSGVISIGQGKNTIGILNCIRINPLTTDRFQDGQAVEEHHLQSVDEAQQVLLEQLGIPLESTARLTIDSSGKDKMWSFMHVNDAHLPCNHF